MQHVLAMPQNQEEWLVDNVERAFPLGTNWGIEHPNNVAEHTTFPHVRASGCSWRLDAFADVSEVEVVGLQGQSRAQCLVELQCLVGQLKEPED